MEAFSPGTKMTIIKVLLSLGADLSLDLQQLDVKNAFLIGDLKEDTKGKLCKL